MTFRGATEAVADGAAESLSLTDYITLGNSGLKVREALFPAFSLSRELSREFSREKTREFVFRGETRINTGELETTRELAGK